jgi:hypothetical protein
MRNHGAEGLEKAPMPIAPVLVNQKRCIKGTRAIGNRYNLVCASDAEKNSLLKDSGNRKPVPQFVMESFKRNDAEKKTPRFVRMNLDARYVALVSFLNSSLKNSAPSLVTQKMDTEFTRIVTEKRLQRSAVSGENLIQITVSNTLRKLDGAGFGYKQWNAISGLVRNANKLIVKMLSFIISMAKERLGRSIMNFPILKYCAESAIVKNIRELFYTGSMGNFSLELEIVC